MYLRLRKKKLIFKREKLFSRSWFKNEKRMKIRKGKRQKKKFLIKTKNLIAKRYGYDSGIYKYMKYFYLVNILSGKSKNKSTIKRNTRGIEAFFNKSLLKYFIKKFKFFNKSWRRRALIEQQRYPKEDWGLLFSNHFEDKVLEGKNSFSLPLDKIDYTVQKYIFLYFLNNLIKKLSYNDYWLG